MSGKAMIAMSGGVDSSVAAYLMQQAGFSCVGATMRLLERTSSDVSDAQAIAQRLGMPFMCWILPNNFVRKSWRISSAAMKPA